MVTSSSDPSRGTGPGKVTVASEPGHNAPPHAQDNEAPGSMTPDPARGGCLKLGWGCLPVLIGVVLLPVGLLF